MTRKDYQLIAEALHAITLIPRESRSNGLLLNAFVSRLEAYANFDSSKFVRAVYPKGNPND